MCAALCCLPSLFPASCWKQQPQEMKASHHASAQFSFNPRPLPSRPRAASGGFPLQVSVRFHCRVVVYRGVWSVDPFCVSAGSKCLQWISTHALLCWFNRTSDCHRSPARAEALCVSREPERIITCHRVFVQSW